MRTGTYGDLLFWSKSRCFVSKNHRWGLGPIETSHSDTNRVVLHAQNDRWGLRPMETDANHAVLHAQSDRLDLGPIETINSGHYVTVVNAQTHRWGLGPIVTCSSGAKVAVLNAKNVGEVWDPLRLEIPVQKSLFCLQKPKMMAGTHRY